MALRESVSALLGPKLFARVSPWLQTSTIVLLGSALLLLPPASTRVGAARLHRLAGCSCRRWRSSARTNRRSHDFIVDLPRRKMTARHGRDAIVANTALYEERRPLFPPLARRAEVLFGGVVAIADRRDRSQRAPGAGRSASLLATSGGRRSRVSERIANTLFVRHPAARAGFDFALATLLRSKTHRLTLACAAAVGFAMALVALSRRRSRSRARPTPRLLSIQPLLYGSLLVGFRHLAPRAGGAARELGQSSWRGGASARAFADGVQARRRC